MPRSSQSTRVRTSVGVQVKTAVGAALLAAAGGAAAYGMALVRVVDTGASAAAMKIPIVISRASTSPTPTILLSGEANATVSVFRLTNKSSHAIEVQDMTFDDCAAGRDTDGDCADSGEYPGNGLSVASTTIEYLDASGATRLSTVAGGTTSGGWSALFSGESLYLPALGTADVTVLISVNALASAGVASGQVVQMNMDAASPYAFSAVDLVSGVTYSEANVAMTAMGSPMVLRYSKPTVILSSVSPSGAAIPGNSEALRFHVSAASSGDLKINGLTFAVSAADNAGSNWNSCALLGSTGKWGVTNLTEDPTTILRPSTFLDTAGAPCASSSGDVGYVVFTLPTGSQDLSAGTTHSYKVTADTTGASALQNDTLQLSLPAQSSFRGATGHLRAIDWSDLSAVHLSGTNVKNLPVAGGTLEF